MGSKASLISGLTTIFQDLTGKTAAVKADEVGTEIWDEVTTGSKLSDADGDTYIELEEGADDDHARIYTAGSERVTVDDSGNVGIGTNSPSTLLEVRNNSANFEVGIKTDGNYSPILTFDADRSSEGNDIGVIRSLWDGNDLCRIRFKAGADTINKDDGEISFETATGGSRSERMRIDSSGNVGIGTTSPGYRLVVPDDSASPYVQGVFGNDVSGANKFGGIGVFGEDQCHVRFWLHNSITGNPDWQIRVGEGAGADKFQIYSWTQAANVLTIDGSSGDVGIGRPNPSYRLDAYDNVNGCMARFMNDGNNQNRSGILVTAGADNGSGTTYYFLAQDGNGTNTGNLRTVAGVFQLTDTSDERLKKDISLSNFSGIDTVVNTPVKSFKWKKSGEDAIGFIAQDVQKTFPLAVGDPEPDTGMLGLSRDVMVVPLWKAVQEQQEIIKKQQKRIEDIEQRLAKLEN